MRVFFSVVALFSSQFAFAGDEKPSDKQLDEAKEEVSWHKDQAK